MDQNCNKSHAGNPRIIQTYWNLVLCRDTALCIVLSLQLLIISDGGVKEHVKTDDLPRACVVVLIVNILFIL